MYTFVPEYPNFNLKNFTILEFYINFTVFSCVFKIIFLSFKFTYNLLNNSKY